MSIIMEQVVRLWNSLWDDPITRSFTVLILLIFFYAVYSYRKRKHGAFTRSTSVILTTLGILGTFFGIFIGLQDFDISNTSASFPKLLNGLKIAFSTSILGLFSSLLFRLLITIWPQNQTTSEVEKEKQKDIRDLLKEEIEEVKKMTKAISADEEGSLLGQIKLLKSDMRDGFKEQKKAFEEFADKVSKANARELFKALENVIREFNEKLAEQVGESFKELARSVDRLVEWQENYKNQMEEAKKSLDLAITGIEKGEKSLSQIAESLATIPENIKSIRDIIETTKEQVKSLDRHLQAFAEIRDKASDMLPEIQKNIEGLSTGLKQTVDGQVKAFNDIIESQRSSADQIRVGFEKLESVSENAVRGVQSAISNNLSEMDEALKKALKDYRAIQQEHLNETQESFRHVMTGVTSNLEDAVKQLDRSMHDQVERTMQELVDFLSGITQRQVDDFQPLIQALRETVDEARTNRGNQS